MTTDLSPARATYLRAAGHAADLLADPAVAEAWDRPSALPTWTVATLAGHIASQVLTAPRTLVPRPSDPSSPPVAVLDHYQRVSWVGAPPDAPTNVAIREASDVWASPGAGPLADDVRAALPYLERWLSEASADSVVDMPAGWPVTVDTYATTRTLEICFHGDDLAVSLGQPTTTPDDVTAPVLELLVRLAAARHGSTAVLRTFGRTERAPASVATF